MRKNLLSKWFLVLAILGVISLPSSANAKPTKVSETTSTEQKNSNVVIVVTDNQEQPLIGATVISVEDPSKAAVVGVDGKATLSVPTNSNVTIQLMGYKTQNVAIGGRTTFGVVLEDDVIAVDEVVVVGYGTQKKVNLTGSVATVSEEELALRPVADASVALQGLVPGLTVTTSDASRPGATATFELRGQGNLSGSDSPYILVDGVEGSFSDLNPNDIASISVLKDASASAIYGSRAAYGVILVTTKKGKEGKTRVTYQGTVGLTSPTKLPDEANSYDYATYFNQSCINGNVAAQYSDERLAILKSVCDGTISSDFNLWSDLAAYGGDYAYDNLMTGMSASIYGYFNIDAFDFHYKDFAVKQDHNLSVSGGNEKTKYYSSVGMYTENGILEYADMDYRRITFSTNVSSQLYDWLKLKINTRFNVNDNQTPFGDANYDALGEGFYHSISNVRPHVPFLSPNGTWLEHSLVPYLESENNAATKEYRAFVTGGLEISPLKNWNIFVDYSVKYSSTEYEALNTTIWVPGYSGTLYECAKSHFYLTSGGRYTRRLSSTLYNSANIYTDYTFDLGSDHNLVVLGGYQEEENTYKYLKTTATDLISVENPSLDLAVGDQTIAESRTSWATRGFFGRINYNYKEKYLVEFNGRYDGSSRFLADNRWGFFPSASAGWNITKESFMESTSNVLSLLKLRASWGQLGNQSGADTYTFASTMSTTAQGSYLFADGKDMYISSPSIISGTTTWETVETINLGVDFSLLQGKISGSFDIFQRDTRDMLGPSVDLPDMFGGSAPNTNNANMRSKGWEFSLNYRGKIGNDITFSIGGMVADAKSYVTSYQNPTGSTPNSSWYVGKNVGEVWGYKSTGIIQSQAEADEFNKLNTTYLTSVLWTPGDLAYVDLNGDGEINQGNKVLGDMGDFTVIGNETPRYQYSLNGSIAWKGLSLSMLWQGVGKRDWLPTMSDAYFWGATFYASFQCFDEHLDYWTYDNPDAWYPNPYAGTSSTYSTYQAKTATASSYVLQDASYIRLKNLTVSYNLPQKITNKIGIGGIQVYFTGENLLTFTSLSSIFDPEAVFLSNTYTSQAGKNYPINKVYSFGLVLDI